jgi:hypothetical protein
MWVIPVQLAVQVVGLDKASQPENCLCSKTNARVGRGLSPTFAPAPVECLISVNRGWLDGMRRPIGATARQTGGAQSADKRLANDQGLLL